MFKIETNALTKKIHSSNFIFYLKLVSNNSRKFTLMLLHVCFLYNGVIILHIENQLLYAILRLQWNKTPFQINYVYFKELFQSKPKQTSINTNSWIYLISESCSRSIIFTIPLNEIRSINTFRSIAFRRCFLKKQIRIRLSSWRVLLLKISSITLKRTNIITTRIQILSL